MTKQEAKSRRSLPMSAPNWKQVAHEVLEALWTFNAFYDDLSKSNPGFMGKLCLRDYAQWNKALLQSENIKRKYGHLINMDQAGGGK